jgi:type IV pilus assembly protein PilC
MFAPTLSLQNLIDLCRILRHNLSAGLTLQHVFRQQADKGPSAIRTLARGILEAIETGQSLTAALEAHQGQLPPLFLSMVKVGEQTGHLPEIFEALEKHYLLEQRLRRQIVRQTLGTFIQLVAALFIIAGLIFVLGIIAQSRGGASIRIFGLSGASGAIIFLAVTFGALGGIWLLSVLFLRYPRHAAPVQAVLMGLPGLGPCLVALVMGRFTMALRLTLDSGLSIVKGLKLSLQATGNAWFASKTDVIAASLKQGNTLTDALTQSGLFDLEFLHIVAAAEEGGRVPEMMAHQAQYWHEEATRRLSTAARLATLGLWLLYAGLMVYAIFQIAAVYLRALGV